MAVSAKAGIGLLRGGGFAALSILLPLAVYFLLLPLVLDGLVPDWLRISSLPLRAAPAEEITGDFSARMDYGLAMAMVIVFSLLVLIEAIWSFAKRRLYRLLGFLVFASLAAGVTTYIADEHVEERIKTSDNAALRFLDRAINCDADPWRAVTQFASWSSGKLYRNRIRDACDDTSLGEKMRALAISRIIEIARQGPNPPDEDLLDAAFELAAITAALGIAALVALVFRFALLAWSEPPEKTAGREARLRSRWRGFRFALILAAVSLTVSVVATRAFYSWPLTLLTGDSAEAYAATSAAAAGFWGTLFTLFLVAAAAPAALSIWRDIDRAAGSAKDPAARDKWLNDERLTLKIPEGIGAALAAAAPLLASPTIDAIRAVAAP